MDGSKHLEFAICQLSLSSPKNLTVVVREEFFMFVIDYHCLLKINIKEVTDQFLKSFWLFCLPSSVSLGNSKMGQLKFCFIFWQILSYVKWSIIIIMDSDDLFIDRHTGVARSCWLWNYYININRHTFTSFIGKTKLKQNNYSPFLSMLLLLFTMKASIKKVEGCKNILNGV